MRLNEVTRSHVRGQSSPNLNLYSRPSSFLLLLPPPLARSTLVTRMHGGLGGRGNANLSSKFEENHRENHRIRFHSGRLKIRTRAIRGDRGESHAGFYFYFFSFLIKND